MKKIITGGFSISILLFSFDIYAQTDTLKTFGLDEVVVSATRTEKKIGEVGRNMTIISSEEILKSGANQLSELLARQAGIYIVGMGQSFGAQQNLFLRGASPNHTAVFIDGVRVTDPSTPNSAIDFSEISLADIERIEIVRGSHGTLFGTGAVGGMINIITKKRAERMLTGRAEFTAGGVNPEQSPVLAQTLHAGFNAKSGFYANASVRNFDFSGADAAENALPQDPNTVPRDRDGFRKTDAAFRTGFSNRTLDVFAGYKRTHQKADIDAGAFRDDNNNTLRLQRDFIHYGASYRWADRAELKFSGGYSYLRRHNLNLPTVLDLEGNTDFTFSDDVFTGKLFTNELQFSYKQTYFNVVVGLGAYAEKMGQKTFLDIGGPFPFQVSSNLDTLGLRSVIRYAFLYGELNGGLLGEAFRDVTLTGGFRVNAHTLFGNYFTGQAGLSYAFPDQSLIYASYSSGFNAPSLYQLYAPSRGFGAFTNLGNERLRPEISETYELGFKTRLFSALRLDVSVFASRVKSAIEYVYLWDGSVPVENLNFLHYRGDIYLNLAEQRNTGAEAVLEWQILKNLTLTAALGYVQGKFRYEESDIDREKTGDSHIQLFSNGTFVQARRDFEGLVRRPRLTTNVSLAYEPCKNAEVRLQAYTAGSRTDSVYDPALGPFGALNTIPVAGYALFDVSGFYRFAKGFFSGFRLENVLNKEFREIRGFTTRGRSIYLSFGVEW